MTKPKAKKVTAHIDQLELGRLQERVLEREDRLHQIAEILNECDRWSYRHECHQFDPDSYNRIYALAKGKS